MKKSNKIWLSSLSLLAGAVPLLAVACKDPEAKNKYVFEYSSPYNPQAFLHDASRSYGSFISTSTTQHTSVGLVRIESIGEPEVQSKVIVDESGNVKDTKRYIINPTWTKRSLALASAVVVTDNNGTVTTFDSDEAEVKTPANAQENGVQYYTSPSVELKSNNEKSINSANFEAKLKTAKKLQFVVRRGVHWTNEQGEATKYEIKAKDFYYSWLRTLYVNQSYRIENGGSEELDKQAAEALSNPSSVAFTDKENYSNDYLFTLFGVDHKKFSVENEFIQKVGEEEAVTFEKIEGKETANFNEFFSKSILQDYTFAPAPSEYIDEANQTGNYPIYNYIGTQTDKTTALVEKIKALDKTSKTYISGAYWYGVSLKNTLYSGAYYIAPQRGQELVLKKNKNYYDKAFVESKNTIEQIVDIYNQGLDVDTFAKRVFDKYKQGKLSQISFSQLKENQRAEILNDAVKYGLRYTKVVNKKRPYYLNFSQPFIKPIPTGQNVSFYGFNDAYAKLVYGSTREQLKNGTNDPASYISGDGLIFRSLLNAAINWDELASQATNGQAFAWIAKVADGSAIGGSDQSSSKFKTPGDVRERINSLFALKADRSGKIDFGGSLGKELSPSENEEAAKNLSTKTEKLKSAGFELIKKELADLFKKFDKENPTLAGQNFEFEYAFPYVNIPAGYKAAFANIVQTFKELNPRLAITVFSTDNKDDPKFDNYRTGGANGTEFVAWSYDYDSIGSGYDGLSWGANFIPTLTWIAANDANDKNKLIKENYPKLYQLAKDIVKYSKESTHEWVGSVPFEDLHLVENKFKAQRLPYTANYEFKKNEQGFYTLQRDGAGKPKPWKAPGWKHETEAYAWTAEFWLNYIHEKPNEYAIGLMEELTSFFNVNFTYNTFKQRNEFGQSLVEKKFIVPDESVTGVSIFSDWKIKNN